MKKIIFSLVFLLALDNTYAQYYCLSGTDSTCPRDMCSRVKPVDIYDTGLLALSYIPNDSTPIKTIPVIINVWRKDDGTGNYWLDTPAFRDSLRLSFYYLNWIYSHNATYSLTIPNAQFVLDARVRFVIDTFYNLHAGILSRKITLY